MAEWFMDDVVEGEALTRDRVGTVVTSEPELVEIQFDNGRTMRLTGAGANIKEPLAVGSRVAFRRIE